MILYYSREGKPLSLREWCALFELLEYKRVAYTADKLTERHVSTVWTGLDRSYGRFGVPYHIFETAVWHGHTILEQERWSTEAEAIQGHIKMCKKWEVPYLVTSK